jgi:hypothetical protein
MGNSEQERPLSRLMHQRAELSANMYLVLQERVCIRELQLPAQKENTLSVHAVCPRLSPK